MRDLERAVQLLEDERSVAAAEIEDRRSALRRLALEQPPHRVEHGEDDERLTSVEAELRGLVAHASDLDERLRACRRELERLAAGETTDPQAHIRHRHRPGSAPGESGATGGVAERGQRGGVDRDARRPGGHGAGRPWWVLVAICAALTIDAVAQHHLVQLLLNATIVLAVISVLVLLVEFWQPVIIVALLAFLVMLVVQNLEELRHT